jgi:hypothetical protein
VIYDIIFSNSSNKGKARALTKVNVDDNSDVEVVTDASDAGLLTPPVR